ncbi:hypothetical protein QBC38DRAFT_481968 [Podospora fimiseda]|uniref:Uncharacterized protein n=1 Tax=Podospora fimiseda TaxID=252190 RepID=A0AAN7BMU3_9PEZI|nr:hypothetical protein QBC38DRAFT_481968 [Podospora fimiseda]
MLWVGVVLLMDFSATTPLLLCTLVLYHTKFSNLNAGFVLCPAVQVLTRRLAVLGMTDVAFSDCMRIALRTRGLGRIIHISLLTMLSILSM